LWDYEGNKLINNYLHTFLNDFSTLGIVGLPRVLTFRSFKYQAIALARLFSGRQAKGLPGLEEMKRWEKGKKFHDIEWETGETVEWLGEFYGIAGLGRLDGRGRNPPRLGREVRWAIENIRKYPEPWNGEKIDRMGVEEGKVEVGEEWVFVERGPKKDLLHFI